MSKAFEQSCAQERFWILAQLYPESTAYNVLTAIRFRGVLELPLLREALRGLMARHEPLRTSFSQEDGRPVQRIAPSLPLPLELVESPGLSGRAREEHIARHSQEVAAHVFELEQPPLLRLRLLRFDAEEHVLLVLMHHIISDGWSTWILVKDLMALYEALRQGRPPLLDEVPIQYVDFAAWERSQLTSTEMEASRAWWRKQLAGAPPVLRLPTDAERPHVPTFSGAREPVVFPAVLVEQLRALSRAEGVSLFSLLLGTFGVLLYRHSGQEDLVIGVPVARRDRPELEPLIGCLINPLPLRLRLSGDPSFRAFLRTVHEAALQAYLHQALPFEQIVQELHIPRETSHAPVFQVLFGLNNAPRPRLELPGLRLELLEPDTRTTQLDLTLNLDDSGHELSGVCEFNTTCFARETIQRLLERYRCLLEAVVAGPSRPLSWLPYFSPSELRELELLGTGSPRPPLAVGSLHEAFEAQARSRPDAIAVMDEQGKRLSYRELEGLANALARRLLETGIAPEEPVGICAERSVELVVGLLGIIKAGGAYVPLDPDGAQARTERMLVDTGVSRIVTQQHLADRFPLSRFKRELLEALSVPVEAPRSRLQASVCPANLAYVLFTSGSTGLPSGVAVQHASVLNHLDDARRMLELSAEDVVLSVATATFDISVMELFLPLLSGARLLIASQQTSSDGRRLQRVISEHGVTVMQSVPTQWRLYLETGWEGAPRLRAICGGEALTEELARKLLGRVGSLRNMYGPTETTIWSTGGLVSADAPHAIGKPIANTRVHVLDAHLMPVPLGVPGELYIGGAGLARGYHGRPELTAGRFIPDPFSQLPGARLYRTGDRARFLPDGRLEYLGRHDEQVKIMGCRIELSEVEAALSRSPAIKRAVVVSRSDDLGELRLVAYVVAAPGATPSEEELAGFARAQLPAYMLPADFVFLEELPTSPSGKVDRQALPAPPSLRRRGARASGPRPHTALEVAVAAIWSRLLKVEDIGLHDEFFALGGSSLLAIRAIAEVRSQLGVDLPLRSLFDTRTLKSLCEAIERRDRPTGTGSSLVRLHPGGPHTPCFLVHPTGGMVHCYQALSQHLGLERPTYGLQQRGVDGEAAPHTRIEAMATHYLQELEAIEPHGPYLLGGWSLGGIIAYEMAHQLQARGESVALLALLDTPAPLAGIYHPTWSGSGFMHFVSQQLTRVFDIPLDVLPRELELLSEQAQREHLISRMVDRHMAGSAKAAAELLNRFILIHRASDEAMLHYRAPRLHQPLLLLRCEDPSDLHPDSLSAHPTLAAHDYGWSQLSSAAIEVHMTAGRHQTMLMEPQVQRAAHLLRTSLMRAAPPGSRAG